VNTLAVYDCMLFFRAVSRPSRVRPLFDLVAQGQVTICFSPDVLAEIRDVLTRPKLQAKYPALTSQAVDAFLAQHLRTAKWVSDVPERYVLARDPKDSKYLNLAIAAHATYVVTSDLDLLDLMDANSPAGQDFRGRFPDVRIVEPAAFHAAISTSGAGGV
jgi:putative PIN family toxin of toxin-antitoxin system